MILIINTSNISKGGTIQVSISFIKECIRFNENEYHVLLSTQVSAQINHKEYPENFHFYQTKITSDYPGFFISTIRQLKRLENEIKPDCVFSIFGPSYWTPKSPHLMGFALGLYIYPEYFKFIKYSFKDLIIFSLKKQFHKYYLRKNASFYFTETTDASKRLSKFLGNKEKKIFSISNTFSHVFDDPLVSPNILPLKNDQEFRILTISAYFVHKNLEIINKIIPFLKESNISFKFILTLPEDIYKRKFANSTDSIINIGPVPLSLVPYLYTVSDALFQPTLVECFSASYAEAMKMKKPILTSDLSFAHDICGDAAEYFDPLNPEDIADKIVNLVKNKVLQKELIKKGEKRLLHFETPESRARKLLGICSEIIKR